MKIIEKPVDKEFQSNEPMFATLISSDGELLKHLTVNLETTKKSYPFPIPGKIAVQIC